MVIGWFLMEWMETGIAILVKQKHFLIYISFFVWGPVEEDGNSVHSLTPSGFFHWINGYIFATTKKRAAWGSE